jgi:hypothetical protein
MRQIIFEKYYLLLQFQRRLIQFGPFFYITVLLNELLHKIGNKMLSKISITIE